MFVALLVLIGHVLKERWGRGAQLVLLCVVLVLWLLLELGHRYLQRRLKQEGIDADEDDE